MGISCDSIYSHDAWAKALGGISFHCWRTSTGTWSSATGSAGRTQRVHRATFVIDGQGLVRFVERYGRGQLPDPAKVLAEVQTLG